jgi:hypothetical protein
MVILQFNKLIRNKWIWGVFAIIVGGAFAFDFLVDDLLRDDKGDRGDASSVGTLGGENVPASLFRDITEELRGFGQNRDWRRKSSEVNREAWEICAMLEAARRNGLEATDAEVAKAIRSDRSFQKNGQFSFALYQGLLRENSLTPERFEQFLKRRLTMSKIAESGAGSAVWASPMEVEQAVNDMTDSFTVKVARFAEDKKEADAVKLDEEGLKKWYDEHAKSLELPERIKLRMVAFDATDTNVLAKMVVSEDALRDHYDVTVDKYTSTDTNGVETVKKFEEVRDLVDKEVRQVEAVEYFVTNLNSRVYGVKAAEGKSRLDEIAAEEGRKVVTTDWFAPDGTYKEGFMKRAYQICPGAQTLNEVVAELDSDSEDLRYGVVRSDRMVWLVEKVETSPAHVPTFEEAKEIVRPRALDAAKADAFKAKVEAVAKKGVDAVLASGNVSTNITFAVCDLNSGAFPDQNAIVGAAIKLRKGEISEFTSTGKGRGLLVVCEDRVPGDAAKAQIWKLQVRGSAEALQRRQIPEAWQKWNLERLGFETGDGSSVVDAEEEE